jgi:hypothetical protein
VKTHALEPEAVYGTQGMFPGGLAETAGGQVEARSVFSADELSRHQQNLLAQGLESGVLELWRQTEALEPIDQIVGEQQQVKVGFVGQEVMTGDMAECVISLELANDQFDTGAVVVAAPEVERLQRQIGDQDLVVVAAELEQCQLLGRLLGLWAANDHEAIAAPPAGRLVAELGDLDAAAWTGDPRQLNLPASCLTVNRY